MDDGNCSQGNLNGDKEGLRSTLKALTVQQLELKGQIELIKKSGISQFNSLQYYEDCLQTTEVLIASIMLQLDKKDGD